MLTIYKPGQLPVRGLRTSLKGAQLADGQFQAISNLRWDNGVLTVRDGIATVASSTPSGTCVGAWSGSLNGTYYVVSAWLVSGKTQIHSLNLATGTFTELTNSTTRLGSGTNESKAISGASSASPIVITASGHGFETGDTVAIASVGGNTAANGTWTITRIGSNTFSLDGSTWTSGAYTSGGSATAYADVVFTPHVSPRKVIAGTTVSPVDVLSFQNRHHYPRIWNPSIGTSFVIPQRNIAVPQGGTSFTFLKRFSTYFPVASASGKTFTNKAVDNVTAQTRWKLIPSAIPPYTTGADTCIDLVAATPVTGDWAKLSFASGVYFAGEQINVVVQGSITDISDMIFYSKLEVSADDSTYYPLYDPTSSDPTLTSPPLQTDVAPGSRTMLTFSLKSVPVAARTLRYFKFTRTTGLAVAYTLTILAICGAGPGAGFYGDTEWALAYGDRWSQAESGGIVGDDSGYDLLKNVGGPSVVTSGSTTLAGTKIGQSNQVLYDYSLKIVNPGSSATVNGNMDGVSTNLDLYWRNADESAVGSDHLYWNTLNVYSPDTAGTTWQMVNAFLSGGNPVAQLSINTEIYGWGSQFGNLIDRNLRDPGTPLPSAYNVAMPRAGVVTTANQRTFAGDVRDTTGACQHGDLYFSALGFPFRFASLQETEQAGSRLTFAGERVRAVIMTAAAANGASVIYVLTDQSFNALGTAGGFVGSGYEATALSTRVRINGHGTNEPGSIAERAGTIFYIDQEGQIIRFDQGAAISISRNAVDDKTRSIPAGRRGKAHAAFWKDRYYLAYTPPGGSSNTHLLAWNEAVKEWEFDDTLPSAVTSQEIVRAFDLTKTGSGQRLLLFSGDSKVYAYEEGTTEPGSGIGPFIQLRTREYQSPQMELFRFGVNQVMLDAHSATLNVDCTYKPRDSEFRGTIDCSDAEGKPRAIKKDTKARVEQSSTGEPENGWSGFLDFNGNLAAGKTIWRIESDWQMLSKGAGER